MSREANMKSQKLLSFATMEDKHGDNPIHLHGLLSQGQMACLVKYEHQLSFQVYQKRLG